MQISFTAFFKWPTLVKIVRILASASLFPAYTVSLPQYFFLLHSKKIFFLNKHFSSVLLSCEECLRSRWVSVTSCTHWIAQSYRRQNKWGPQSTNSWAQVRTASTHVRPHSALSQLYHLKTCCSTPVCCCCCGVVVSSRVIFQLFFCLSTCLHLSLVAWPMTCSFVSSPDKGGAVLSAVVDYYLESSSSQAILLLSSIRETHHKVSVLSPSFTLALNPFFFFF